MSSPVEFPEMIDTHVLIYASLTSSRRAKDARIASLHQTSLDLLRRVPVVRVSAIAWMEYVRQLRADERNRMAEILKKVVVDRVDAPIAEFAAELVQNRSGIEKAGCARCLSTEKSEKCGKCGRYYSAQQRLNDAIIVATGHVLPMVETVWSFDGGVLELGKHVTGCRVQRPRSETPLFDPEQNSALAAATSAATAKAGGGANLVSIPPVAIGAPASDDD